MLQQQHIVPNYSSSKEHPPLQTFKWDQMVTNASEILPHLLNGRILSSSRHDILDITYVDYYQSFRGPPVSFKRDSSHASVVGALGDIPDDVKQRVVIVEELSPRTIACLGTRSGMSPEFFEEHLINSGYVNGNYDDQSPYSWITAGMTKAYVSMRWHRPVFRLPVVPYSKPDLEDLLDPEHGRVEYTSNGGYQIAFQTGTNIFRPEWELWIDRRTNTRAKRVCGWEGRASIWTQKLKDRDCQIGTLDIHSWLKPY
jgi:hypothetical protein